MYYIFSLLLTFFLSTWPHTKSVETIYGTFTITESVLVELLESQAVHRLEKINQYGIDHYVYKKNIPYTRYTHSVGVLVLLRKHNASLKEQIAGLLHDASHTVFSHVGDHVWAQLQKKSPDQNQEAYQDKKHIWLLSQTDVPTILEKHGMCLDDIDHKNGSFIMLEQDLPDICADRLEYNIMGGFVEGWLTKQEVAALVDAVQYTDGKWFFNNEVAALKLGRISIRLCQEIFAPPGAYEPTAAALLQALSIKLISIQDILFGTDGQMLSTLSSSDDPIIQESLKQAFRGKDLYQVGSQINFDLCYKAKFRGIDPWVQTNSGLMRLSSINPQYKEYFDRVKKQICDNSYFLLKPTLQDTA